jgi:sugar phosphate isomerase/epimerase
MRIGLDHYTIADRGQPPGAVLAWAHRRGLEGVQFLEPAQLDPALDPGRLVELKAQADALGLYLEVGIASPNPFRAGRAAGRAVTPAEHAQALAPALRAVAALGGRAARAYVGDRHDRFRADAPWSDQLRATAEVLRALRPLLGDLGLRLAIETHADLTCDELLALIDAVGDDVLGVTLDTGNLLMRLDDPLRAAEELAPMVLLTHVKDCVLAFTPRGLCWQARPVGAGAVPIAEILACLQRHNPALNLSIELHPRTYDLPIFEPAWRCHFHGLTADALAAVVQVAADCERRYAEGTLERPDAVEAIPWPERVDAWIDRSLAFLRGVVTGLA